MLRGVANVVLLGLLVGSLCWAGGQTEPVPAAEPSAAMAATKYQEAPMLSALVRAGKLPPVDERLPAEPLVVEPLEEIGQYGGTWRRATRAKSSWAFWGYVIKQNEIRYTPDFRTIVPHIFQDYEVADGNRTFTFHLREGLRWSDGAVSSADDFEFWWNDLVLNDDYTPVKPQDFMLAKELATFTRVDDHTIQLSFSQPNALFLDRLARPRIFNFVQPSHYGKQFHPSYLEQADLDALLKEGGYDTWIDLMRTKLLFFGNPELPQLIAWVPLDDNTGAIQRFERNPYFWKVDTANNQLPYIDRVETVFTPDTQTTLLKAMAGDIDMQYREMGGADDFSLLMQNAEKADYRIINTATAMHNTHTHVFNYTHPDPVMRELFLDKRFRVALSIAINREELNNLLHKGLNEIQAAASVTPGRCLVRRAGDQAVHPVRPRSGQRAARRDGSGVGPGPQVPLASGRQAAALYQHLLHRCLSTQEGGGDGADQGILGGHRRRVHSQGHRARRVGAADSGRRLRDRQRSVGLRRPGLQSDLCRVVELGHRLDAGRSVGAVVRHQWRLGRGTSAGAEAGDGPLPRDLQRGGDAGVRRGAFRADPGGDRADQRECGWRSACSAEARWRSSSW